MNTLSLLESLQGRIGQFVSLPITDLSYYPTDEVQDRIKLAVCGKIPRFAPHVPLHGTCKVSGTFTLFLPAQEPPYGMMDLRSIHNTKHPDINLSIVSPIARMPHRLHLTEWGNQYSFYAIDEEGSKWSIHCLHS